MFRRRGGKAAVSKVSRQQFTENLARGTRSWRDWAYVYLILEEGGTVAVKWEGSYLPN